MEFFQRATRRPSSAVSGVSSDGEPQEQEQQRRRSKRNSFIGLDGKIQDRYIAQRAALNTPEMTTVPGLSHNNGTKPPQPLPLPVDLLTHAETMTTLDGTQLAYLFLCGYARLSSKVAELNRINVFPIADGDTGANMKVCLKVPARNLLLEPTTSIVRVAANMAADVLLNGQGNSGTILSHFYVSLAEEIGTAIAQHEDSLAIADFATCLANTGRKMAAAVPNPQEGTIVSVSRDACAQLASSSSSYANLKELLQAWHNFVQIELKKTPDQLIVDGVKVLEKAGVVDSGAQGFAYIVEGMMLATKNQLPELQDPNLFKTGVKNDDCGDDLATIDDHTVCDTKYQYCTEAVILLKEDCTKQDVLTMIQKECDGIIGDSVACVGAPAREGGHMCKIHIHTNDPQQFYDKLVPFSRGPIFKKEKVEDMKIMRDLEHVEGKKDVDFNDAKFTIIAGSNIPSPEKHSGSFFSFPLFLVPSDTEEPIDYRFVSDTDVCVALNRQRNESTAVQYTTASSNPMQMKIELLSALAKGKPILVFLITLNKEFSSFGRNLIEAIDMLDPQDKKLVKLFVHGSFTEPVLVMAAIEYAKAGKSIDETYGMCEDIANRTVQSLTFRSSKERKFLKKLRPKFFTDEIIDGTIQVCGTTGSVAQNGRPIATRMFGEFVERTMTDSSSDAYKFAVQHIKAGLAPGQKIGNVLIPCVGRPDYGKQVLKMIEDAGIEIEGTPRIFNDGIFGVMKEWGSISLQYRIVE